MAMPAMQFAFEESQKYKEGKFILEKVCMVYTGSLTGCWNCIVKRCRCGAGQSAERRILVSMFEAITLSVTNHGAKVCLPPLSRCLLKPLYQPDTMYHHPQPVQSA